MRMRITRNTHIHLQLTRTFEAGRRKCEQYWPEGEHDVEQYGNVRVYVDYSGVA